MRSNGQDKRWKAERCDCGTRLRRESVHDTCWACRKRKQRFESLAGKSVIERTPQEETEYLRLGAWMATGYMPQGSWARHLDKPPLSGQ